jgi:predicted nucleic acid-binding protein
VATTETLAVVCDAGPLIHLDELDALALLADFRRVLVPSAVWLEVEHHRSSALSRPGIAFSQVMPRAEPDVHFLALAQGFSLDAGEREALRVAVEHPEALLLTDDAAARLAGELLRIRVHGTIGVLIRAIRRRQRSPFEVISLIERIPTQSSLHVRPVAVHEALDQLRREFPGARSSDPTASQGQQS